MRPPPDDSAGPSGARFSLALAPELRAVAGTLRELRHRLAGALPQERLDTAELVAAEILNNVVKHAFGPDGDGPGAIRLDVALAPGRLTLAVTDDGCEMPGGSVPEGDPPQVSGLPVHDLPEGGFGWSLIHGLSGGLSYHRRDGRNHLTVWIDL